MDLNVSIISFDNSFFKTFEAIGGNRGVKKGMMAGPIKFASCDKTSRDTRKLFFSLHDNPSRSGFIIAGRTSNTYFFSINLCMNTFTKTFSYDPSASIKCLIPSLTIRVWGCSVSRSPSKKVTRMGLYDGNSDGSAVQDIYTVLKLRPSYIRV